MAEETHLENALNLMMNAVDSPVAKSLENQGIRITKMALARPSGPAEIPVDWVNAPGISAIGIAERTHAGTQIPGALAIKVYVEKKRPKSQLEFVVPPVLEFEGLPPLETDVEQIGKIELHSNVTRVRPAPPGFSIGLSTQPKEAGTFGLVVRKKGTTGPMYMLSNSHAIAASGWANKGDRIVQPGCADGGLPDSDGIATLTDGIPFQYTDQGFPNTVDCAIAKLDDGAATAAIAQLGVPKGVDTNVKRGVEVQKMGRTTTFSVAQVRDVHLHVPSTYPDKNGTLARVGFSDVCLTSFYTAGGDSGSGVLDMQGNVVGLHMAGSTVVGIFCKIKNVMAALGVEVVTQANQNG